MVCLDAKSGTPCLTFQSLRMVAMKKSEGNVITNADIEDKTRVGYVRVSSLDQNEARQLEAFKDLNLYKIFVEKVSTRDTQRPILQQMLDYLREGDTVYIKDFSRLARSTKDLLTLAERFNAMSVKLISLKENFDTSTPTGKLMLTMMAAIYEFERDNTLERQREGIAIAKQSGKYKGRKKIERPVHWDEIYGQYMNRQITAKKAMEILGLKRNTFYKLFKETLHEMEQRI